MAALIGGDDLTEKQQMEENLDGVPILDNNPIDFSGGAALDGEPMVSMFVIIVNCYLIGPVYPRKTLMEKPFMMALMESLWVMLTLMEYLVRAGLAQKCLKSGELYTHELLRV